MHLFCIGMHGRRPSLQTPLFERLRLLVLWQKDQNGTLYMPLYLLAGCIKGDADKRERKYMLTTCKITCENHEFFFPCKITRKNNLFFDALRGSIFSNRFPTRDSYVSKPQLIDTQRTLENRLKQGTIRIGIDQRGMLVQTNRLNNVKIFQSQLHSGTIQEWK